MTQLTTPQPDNEISDFIHVQRANNKDVNAAENKSRKVYERRESGHKK